MLRRYFLIIAIVLIFLLVFIAFFGLKKINLPLQIKRPDFSSISTLSGKALELEKKGSLFEAKSAYQRLMAEFPNANEVANWQKKVEDLNIKLLFSPVITPKSILYTIKSGDTLTKIAKEFNTVQELIMKSNHLTEDKIFLGRKIKIWTAPFTIVVDKSQNILMLKSDEEVIKTYIVSTGANNCTPVGKFKIVSKLTKPTWFKAGAVIAPGSPENILGSRWLGLDLPGYGIHGTTEPLSLGKQVTQGCIRMSNPEAEELYSIVGEGTEVTIVD